VSELPLRRWPALHRLMSFGLALPFTFPAWCYDFPLSSPAIRDAYFLGTRQAVAGSKFLHEYTHTIAALKVGENFVSRVRVETPFVHVADHASRAFNYSAQDAVKDFYDKPAVFRIYLELCYMQDAPLPHAVTITVIQNDKEILPKSDERSAFFPATDPYTYMPNLGEKVELEFDPQKFDSSTLTIRIDTPDDQHGKTEFDLQSRR